jgi:hypothetical protein
MAVFAASFAAAVAGMALLAWPGAAPAPAGESARGGLA